MYNDFQDSIETTGITIFNFFFEFVFADLRKMVGTLLAYFLYTQYIKKKGQIRKRVFNKEQWRENELKLDGYYEAILG